MILYIYLIIAFLFFLLTKLAIEKLLAILILIFVFYYMYTSMQTANEIAEKSVKANRIALTNDVSDKKELNTENYYVEKTKKNIKYLLKNPVLIDIIKNINFVKKFNKSKYSSLIVHMNKLMKVYIYMLADRYDINTYVPIFNDLKADILEIFYSLVFIIPENIPDVYAVEPHKEIQKSVDNFLIETRRMLTIIKNYMTIEKKEHYINIHKYKPFEKNKESYLP